MFDIIIGVLAIVLGILSALQRIFKPESSRKLVAMRKTYGEKKSIRIALLEHVHLASRLGKLLLGVRLVPNVVSDGVLLRLEGLC